MKIAYVSLTDPDAAGGIGTHLFGMAKALAEEGNDVMVICPSSDGASRESHDGFTVQRLAMGERSGADRIRYDLAVARCVKSLDVDVAVFRLTTSLVLAPALTRFARCLMLFEINGPTWNELYSEKRSRVQVVLSAAAIKAQLRLAQGFIAVTPLLRDFVADFGPAIEVPNGSDWAGLPVFDPPDEPFTIAFAGAFTQWYDIELAIDSLPELEARLGRDVRFLMIGDGARLPEITERLEADPEAAARVSLLPWMERTAALELVSRSNVGIIPLRPKTGSIELGSPLKLFDYVAMGLPTVVPRLDGCSSVDSRLVHYYEYSSQTEFVEAVLGAGAVAPLSDGELAELRASVSWNERANRVVEFAHKLRDRNG